MDFAHRIGLDWASRRAPGDRRLKSCPSLSVPSGPSLPQFVRLRCPMGCPSLSVPSGRSLPQFVRFRCPMGCPSLSEPSGRSLRSSGDRDGCPLVVLVQHDRVVAHLVRFSNQRILNHHSPKVLGPRPRAPQMTQIFFLFEVRVRESGGREGPRELVQYCSLSRDSSTTSRRAGLRCRRGARSTVASQMRRRASSADWTVGA